MAFIFRKTAKLGPFRFHFTNRGLSSWGIKIGRWSWNSHSRAHRVDLPGPLSWRSKGKGRGRGHGRRYRHH